MRVSFLNSKYSKATKASLLTLIGFMFLFEVSGHLITIIYNYTFSDINAETTGEIVSSDRYRVGHATYAHNIRYRYEVDGDVYFSRSIDYQDAVSDARKKVAKYYEGKEVRVYYDSSKPYLAVLDVTDLAINIVISLAVAILISVFVFIWNIHETPRNRIFKPQSQRKW